MEALHACTSTDGGQALTVCACRQLEQAEAFLRAAGLDPSALKEGAGKKHRKKDKKDKHKHKHRRKHKP